MTPRTAPTGMHLTPEELNLVREWFNLAQDHTRNYLEQKDYMLAKAINEALGFRVADSIKRGAGTLPAQPPS